MTRTPSYFNPNNIISDFAQIAPPTSLRDNLKMPIVHLAPLAKTQTQRNSEQYLSSCKATSQNP